VASLRVLIWLREPGGRRLTSWLVSVADRRGGLFLLAIPLCGSQLLLRPFFPGYLDWADVATYTLASCGAPYSLATGSLKRRSGARYAGTYWSVWWPSWASEH